MEEYNKNLLTAVKEFNISKVSKLFIQEQSFPTSIYPLIWLIENATLENNGYTILDLLLSENSPYIQKSYVLTGVIELAMIKEKYGLLYLLILKIIDNAPTNIILKCIDFINELYLLDYIKEQACKLGKIKILKYLYHRKNLLFTKQDVQMCLDNNHPKIAKQVFNLLCEDLNKLRKSLIQN